MSGDAAGVIFGGILVLVFLPQILTVAAVAAAGSAVVGGVEAIAKSISGLNKNKEKRQTYIKSSKNCSREMDSFLCKLAESREKSCNIEKELLESLSDEMKRWKCAEKSVATDLNMEEVLKNIIGDERKRFHSFIDDKFSDLSMKTEKRFDEEAKSNQTEFMELLRLQKESKEFISGEQEKEKRKQGAADSMIKDAAEIIRYLNTENEMMSGFISAQIEILEKQKDIMMNQYNHAEYEAASITATGILEKALTVLNDSYYAYSRKNNLKIKLLSFYDSLAVWIDKMRYIDFAASEKYAHDIQEDLNDFCQNRIQLMQEDIKEQRNLIESDALNWTERMLQEEIFRVEKSLFPKAEKLILLASCVLENYLKKVDTIEMIADFMEGQQYEADWSIPNGNDYSQPLVTHFINYNTRNEISVVLDVEDPTIESSDLDISLYDFNGDNPNEMSRERLRQKLMSILMENGIVMGKPLDCVESTSHRESGRTEYKDMEQVLKLQPKKLNI